MPHLQDLVEGGRSGNLTTTLPIESPVAWTSLTTGTTPGKHGIYGFLEREGDEFVPTTSEDVRQERVWSHAGREGEVVVMNVPQTFPPERVNGSLVSGYLSIEDSGYTYPDSLQQELEEMNYSIEVLDGGFEPGREGDFMEELNRTVEKRTRAAEMLLDREDWKFSLVTYTGLDRLQHYFWKYRDGGRYEGAIDQHYRKLDERIGELVEQTGENTTVMVVSDHGFGPLEKNVYLNTWLRQEGYLELKGGDSSANLLSRLGLTQQNLVDLLSGAGILDPLKDLFSWLGFNPGTRLPDPGLSDIDFSSTWAYAGNYGGKMYFTGNVERREELLQELESKLKDLEDPETGERVFEEVYRAEEIYTGDMEGAPDLVLEPRPGYRAVGFLGHQSVVEEPPQKSGTHRKNGIYVISGPGIGNGERDADITDVAPTVLDAMSIEIPGDMDRRSLRETQ